MAIPSILANITIPLVGLVDTAIVGHISDASVIGGIAIGTMIFDLLYWNFGFLRVSTSGMTAQALGRGDYKECAKLISQSMVIAWGGAVLIWLLQWLFVRMVIGLVPGSAEAEDFAIRYFYVRVWAAPATLSLMALKGWFIGLQDTIAPMITDIVVNVMNMICSYYLAVCTQVGPIGVAWGTIIAQYTGLVVALVLVGIRCPKNVMQALKEQIKHMGELFHDAGRLIKLNTNLFLRSFCFMVVYVGYTALASQYGDEELAVSSILMKLMMVFSFFVDGFAYAGEALVGKAIGEGPTSGPSSSGRGVGRLSVIVRLLFYWSLGVGAAFTVLYAAYGDVCLRMLTNDADVLRMAHTHIGWLIAMPIVSTIAFMWDGIFAGATAGREIRNTMIWAAVGFVLAYLATYWWAGVEAIYIAYFAHLLARVIYLTIKKNRIYDRETGE